MIVTFESHPVQIVFRRGQRTLSLSINGNARRIRVTAPHRTSLKRIEDFLFNHQNWIQKHLKTEPVFTVFNTMQLPFFGIQHELVLHKDRTLKRVFAEAGKLYCRASSPEVALLNFFKHEALEHANHHSQVAHRLNAHPSAIRIKDTLSRWGSCNRKGEISVQWRLIFAPETVFNYVIAHEICHLLEFNHSDRFWSLVDQVHPTYKEDQKWLKEHGKTLHSYFPK
jgi:predicted metal-dependent hydrolase